jgi:serine/threonine protein kinase
VDLKAPLLLSRYQPEELIARGGSASVYRARDIHLGRDVAVKVFLAGTDDELERARDELRFLAGLGHHGIVAVLDAGIDESSPDDLRPFLVMALARGSSIHQLIQAGGLDERSIGGIGFEVAETLDYIHHHGVIHRDVSPSNIILVDYGSTTSRPRAVLTDFGLAVQAGWTPTGDITEGTAAYMSPEQARRDTLTPAADIYSLGLVLLECFTGTLAFPGTPIESALARISTDPPVPETIRKPWRALLREMTERDPGARPPASDVAERIRGVLRNASHA